MMRQKIFFILLIVLHLSNLSAQEVALPPSPEAAAMKEHVDVPVNMYAGIPQMSVPIHGIQGREITVPITLSYHANGIRVAEEASWVGLGWNLSAGGMITREIRDNDDFGGKSFYDDSSTRSHPYKNQLDRLPKDPSQGGTNSFLFHPWNIETQEGTFLTARLENCDPFQSSCEYESVSQGIINKTEFCPELGPYLTTGLPGEGERKIDTEPDLFTFSFGGYSGKFLFDKKELKYVPLSGTAIKIEIKYATADLSEPHWEITTPDGMIYTFGEDESTRQKTYSLPFNFTSSGASNSALALNTMTCIDCDSQSQTVGKGQQYISTWFLQKIVSPNGDQVDFIYEKEALDTDAFYHNNTSGIRPIPNYSEFMADRLFGCGEIFTGLSGGFFDLGCTVNSGAFPGEIITHTVGRVGYDRVTLSYIDYEYGQVQFETSNRTDLLGGKKLDAIKVLIGTDKESLSLNKSFVFNYEYFTAGHTNGSSTWDAHIRPLPNTGKALPNNFTDAHFNKRLKLKSVQEFGSDGVNIPPYQFVYAENTALPSKTSLAIDYWGYFNNAYDNKILLPSVNTDDATLKASEQQFKDFYNCEGQRLNALPGADRKTNKDFVGGWLLNEVTYPTKGTLGLTYESNQYSYPPRWELTPNTGANATLGGNRNGQVWETPLVNFPTELPPHLNKVNVSLYVGYDLIDDPNDYPSPSTCSSDLVSESGPYTPFDPLPFITLPSIRIRSTDNSFSETYEIKNTISQGVAPDASLNEKYKGPVLVNIELDPGIDYIVEIIPLDVSGEQKLPCNLNIYQVVLNWDRYALIDHAYGGGMRVSKTELKDGRGQTITKLYKYPLQGSDGTPQALLVNHPKFEFPYFMFYPAGEYCNGILAESKSLELFRYSNSQVPIQNSYAGSFVGYSEVEVWHGEAKENGRSKYRFHNKTNNYNEGAQILPPNLPNYYDQLNGSLLEQIDYIGNTDEKVRQVVNTYENELMDHYWNLHLFTFVDPYNLSLGSSVYTCPVYRNHFFFYKDIRQWVKLLKTEEIYYLDGGNVTKVTDFTYNEENFQVATSSFKDSDDRRYTTEYEYPVGTVLEEADLQSTASLLQGYNIISTIIAQRTIVDDTQTGGSKTTYQTSGGSIVPETLFQWEGNAWDPIGTFTSYYEDGFPKTFQKEYYSDPDEFEWYGYGDLEDELSKKGLLAKKTYKDFIWEFDHYPNNRGLKQKREADQTYATFTYDGLQRLETTKLFGQSGTLKSTTTNIYTYGGPNNNTVNTEVIFEVDPESNYTAEPKSTTQFIDGLGRYYKTITHKYHEDANDVTTEEVDFDDFGRIEKKTYLPGSKSTMMYEKSPLNRIEEEKFPDGKKILFDYGAEDNYYTQIVTDEKGNKTTTKTDLLGRTIAVTDAKSGVLQYTYDIWGNINTVTSPQGHQYSYQYDMQNRITSKTIPGGGTTTFGYDDPAEPENGRDLLVWQLLPKDQNDENVKLSFRYDDYDRLIQTFKGNLDDELLIKNEYYEQVGEHIDKIHITRNKILGEEGYTLDTYVYDQFGRVKQYDFDHLLGKDVTINKYDLADRVRQSELDHHGYTSVPVISETTYDTYDRILTIEHQIDDLGPALVCDNQVYNKRGELMQKQIGAGLQTFNYQYHIRGWLLQVNDPLAGFGQLQASCTLSELEEENTEPENQENLSFDQLTIDELLKIRFDLQLKIQQGVEEELCPIVECPEVDCSSEELNQQNVCLAEIREITKELLGKTKQIPCEDGTTEELWVIDTSGISLPMDLLRVALCDGTEVYILASLAEKLCGDYVIQQLIPIQSSSQVFNTRDLNLPAKLNLEELLTLIVEGETPTLNGYVHCGERDCPTEPVDCSEAIISLQQAAIEVLKEHVPTVTVEDLPIYLYDMLTCSGETFYILDEEYPVVEHTGMEVIDTIIIDSLNQPLPVTYEDPTSLAQCADLFYLKLEHEPNGNIRKKIWQTPSRNEMQYLFSYDELNRLKAAKYSERVKVPRATVEGEGEGFIAEGYATMDDDRYGVPSITYDADGNIEKLMRNGIVGECRPGLPEYGLIDNLQYNYGSTPNRIDNMQDFTGHEKGFNPGGATGNYQYDNKGNLIVDPYKSLSIDYSYLNLPQQIVKGGDIINIIYDAAGRKLRQEFIPSEGESMLIDYIGGVEYRNEEINSVYHPEGRVSSEEGEWQYEYFIKDYLANTNLVISDLNRDGCIDPSSNPSEVLQESHYYPFGLSIDGPWATQYQEDENGKTVLDEEGNPILDQTKLNRYQYNGKELTQDLDLNWYAYGARHYDPAIGRFTGADPISDRFPQVSPYNYAENSPISNIDLWGLQMYYAADGRFLGSYGTSNEIRVMTTSEYDAEIRDKLKSQDGPTGFYENWLPAYSIQVYTLEQEVQLLIEWALENRGETAKNNIEYAMSLFSKELTNADGTTFVAIHPGTRADGEKKGKLGGAKVNPEKSKSRLKGWKRYTTIHTHTHGEAKDFSDDRTQYGAADVQWALSYKHRVRLYLVPPRNAMFPEYMGLFDPQVYYNVVEKEKDGHIYKAEHEKAVEQAKSTVYIGN